MKYVTIRNLPDHLASALEREKRQRGTSLNRTLIDLLTEALGLKGKHTRSNGLSGLAGGWSGKEGDDFDAAIAVTEQVDEELWG